MFSNWGIEPVIHPPTAFDSKVAGDHIKFDDIF